MEAFLNHLVAKYNFWLYIILMMIGLYAMIAKNNLIKKLVGMNIFQTAIILFYVSIGSKRGGTIPILEHVSGGAQHAIDPANYVNPLPHVLMLTAIVVSVSTFGVALALAIKIYQRYKTLEEDEILTRIRES
ncbi:MAG: cation:proton antiporter subunit C [Deltaproteobacteria bacterium]|nr:cation:proton antiporter subunit C [Deltaproteobacteria bacterium]MBW1929752.1 cation:proton antiporter subunit C [Deltaproteobacteria bacterium]MBW2024397.1 cation:proton antiporter subunit C [Deltaproteobacteria bacterium]MBW2124497.1 cation:proton antiporter subunit C [Deltaproteobacteria bacterium]RLB16944.1 MAG: NADH-quinone oxidoreductase subunit J [Deltaproteobacteria bacterium]